MGNAGAKLREKQGKPKTGKKVTAKKIQTAHKTGVLAIQSSQLTRLPPEILSTTVATLLTTLDLSHNRLSALPVLSGLVQLKVLNLSTNQLPEWPPGLSHCPKLTVLNLRYCRVVLALYSDNQRFSYIHRFIDS